MAIVKALSSVKGSLTLSPIPGVIPSLPPERSNTQSQRTRRGFRPSCELSSEQLENILLDTMFDLPGLEGVEEVVISPEVVDGTARPLRIYSDSRERSDEVESSA